MNDDRTYTSQETSLLAAVENPPPVKHASVRKIELKEYMEKHFRCDYSMSEFARATGRSLSTFKRDFKKFSELSPERWLTNRRLLAAYDLLRRGRRVTDVCFDVGFKNVSHFSAIFKKRFNMTPCQVRKLGSAE